MKVVIFMAPALAVVGLIFYTLNVAGAPLGIYWDPLSLAFLLGVQVLSSLAFAGPIGVLRAITDPVKTAPAPADLRKARSFWAGQTPLSLMAAALGFLEGTVAMLNSNDTAVMLAKGTSLAALMAFYALALNLALYLPYRFLCERRLAE